LTHTPHNRAISLLTAVLSLVAPASLIAQGGDDMPADPQAPSHTNRLAEENSPYLLQHAHNPVDWRPWGQEAFDEARRRDVPIFLSVGYSTCYWCHVMERESFENEDVAAILNANFVPIKVDREQRPDVDTIYMHAVQALTGRGGWPMSVFLTPPGARGEDDPGLEPFWGGTYFPLEPNFNIPAFPQVLDAMHNAWTSRRDDALEQAETVTGAIRRELNASTTPVQLGPEQPVLASRAIMRIHDAQNGGFGSAPKFPQPVYLELLLDSVPYAQGDDERGRITEAIRRTLNAMALGGMYDQVGGGFHRYSVDALWRVPHFEKMLYDNGQLAALYARAGRLEDDPFWKRIARETCDYVLREMTSPEGGFYSAQDAEVNAREGQNYLWSREQMAETLEGDDLDFASVVYGLWDGPNFQDPHHPNEAASNVLFLKDRPEQIARERKTNVDDLVKRLNDIDARLYEARMRRDQPITDDKIIVAWNGLMITGLAETAIATGDSAYLEAAERAARFILDDFRNDAGRLQRPILRGQLDIDAIFADYSFLLVGLLSLHAARTELGGDSSWLLDAAVTLTDEARELFADPETGAWYDTANDRTDLIVRVRSTDDGAVPAAGTVMILNLLDLYERTSEGRFRDNAGRLTASMSQQVARSPAHPINATRSLIRMMVQHPEMFDAYAFGANAPQWNEIGIPNREGDPVEIFASADEVRIPANGAGQVQIRLQIADGHHINAPDPGIDGLTGLKIEIVGAAGLEAQAEYPEPELYEGVAVNPASDERLMVYSSVVEIPVNLVRTGAVVVGEPRLQISYQVCTETECLAPKTGTIDIRIIADE
jgi:uncharacterized protein YyaL (SSP411 family)